MDINWNDLQFFLAIYETRSFARAALKLKVDETTVGRRLIALELSLGTKLFVRKREGYLPTIAGLRVLETAQPVCMKIRALRSQIQGGDQSFKGNVKVTLPESLAINLVIPRLAEHLLLYPELCVEFISSSQTVNISKRDADIAIRMFRPKEGTLFAKRLGKLRFSFFASATYLNHRGIPDTKLMKDHFLLDYPDSEATTVEAAHLKHLRALGPSLVKLNSRSSMLAAIEANLGVGMLPTIMIRGRRDLLTVESLPSLELETWMVVHSDMKKNARVRVTADFLASVITPNLS